MKPYIIHFTMLFEDKDTAAVAKAMANCERWDFDVEEDTLGSSENCYVNEMLFGVRDLDACGNAQHIAEFIEALESAT